MPKKRTDWLKLGSGKTYAHRTHYPLQCLIFISPLLIFYQVSTAIHPLSTQTDYGWHVVAFILILKFFSIFSIFGNILPLLAVVATLLCWHLARKDRWEFDPRLYACMGAESILWGIPLYVIGLAVAKHIAAAATSSSSVSWTTDVVISIGAGVYEEFLFRFIAFNVLHLLLVDIFEMANELAIPIIIVAAAALFSAYHFLGSDPVTPFAFFFRFALGIYLGALYFFRGYGITVGAHATYDLIVVTLAHLR